VGRWGTVTRKGRVVYDRPKNPFRWCDARRIVRALGGAPEFGSQFVCFIETVTRAVGFLPPEIMSKTVEIAPPEQFSGEFARILLQAVIAQASEDFDGFGGGEFGGGGASRDFGDETPSSPVRYVPGMNPFALGPCGYPWIVMPIQAQCVDQEG